MGIKKHVFENIKIWMALGFSFVLIGSFVKITSELLENEVDFLDQKILFWIEDHRLIKLDHFAIEITALGSTSLIGLFILSGILICVTSRNRFGLLYLMASSGGAALFTYFLKIAFERPRPNPAFFLVDASGYSYPSGHSFGASAVYFSIALLCSSITQKFKLQILFFSLATVFAALVGFSRVYLGVHYPSDVLAGISLGIAWSLLSFAIIKIGQKIANKHYQ